MDREGIEPLAYEGGRFTAGCGDHATVTILLLGGSGGIRTPISWLKRPVSYCWTTDPAARAWRRGFETLSFMSASGKSGGGQSERGRLVSRAASVRGCSRAFARMSPEHRPPLGIDLGLLVGKDGMIARTSRTEPVRPALS